jgi:hypothetical protein
MRPKTVNPGPFLTSDEFTTAKKNPGPGQYEKYETITPKGKHFVSKFESSGAPSFNPPSSERFFEQKGNCLITGTLVPGPGHYSHQLTTMAEKGNYFLSGM